MDHNVWTRAGPAIAQLRKLHSGERDMCGLCYRGEDCSYRALVVFLDGAKIEPAYTMSEINEALVGTDNLADAMSVLQRDG